MLINLLWTNALYVWIIKLSTLLRQICDRRASISWFKSVWSFSLHTVFRPYVIMWSHLPILQPIALRNNYLIINGIKEQPVVVASDKAQKKMVHYVSGWTINQAQNDWYSFIGSTAGSYWQQIGCSTFSNQSSFMIAATATFPRP